MIKTLALAALALCIAGASTLAYADASCSAQAADKKLAGAAKTSFITKCAKDSCDKQADDKKLSGAARTSFTTKCVKDATGADLTVDRRYLPGAAKCVSDEIPGKGACPVIESTRIGSLLWRAPSRP